MAYEIIGYVYKTGTTEAIQTRGGSTIYRRQLTLMQKRFDRNTGEEFAPNYPTLEFTEDRCAELDKFRQGDWVRVSFDISGMKYSDRNTGEEKFFSSLRAFRIGAYTPHQPQPQSPPNPQPQQVPCAQQYPQGQYQGQQGGGNNLPF